MLDVLPSATAALVLGSEDRGLSREDAAVAWAYVSIPTGGRQSLSLPQAAAVALHAFTAEASFRLPEGEIEAGDRERASRRLLALAHRVGFLVAGDEARLEPRVLDLIRRARPDGRELRTLHGFVTAVEQALDAGEERP